MSLHLEKTKSLLLFLQAIGNLRRKRILTYGSSDKVFWFSNFPQNLPQHWRDAYKSAFIADKPEEIPDLWLEVRKKPKPIFPPLPEEIRVWVPQEFQDHPDDYIDREPDQLLDLLNMQITVLVERRIEKLDAQPGSSQVLVEKVPEIRRLQDQPQARKIWQEYLQSRWKPWSQEMRRWRQLQSIYEDIDFMRRRLEEADERYELLLAVGLLQWRDSGGSTIRRHLLTAPAEISLDAGRGILTVNPAVSFETFRIELDMLELQDRPRLDGLNLEDRLAELDVCAWDKEKVAEILRIIANRVSADAQVNENAWAPIERVGGTLCVHFAPALVLRERRSTAYEELISRLLRAFEERATFGTTAPWDRFVSEGDGLSQIGYKTILKNLDDRLYFPLPTNEEQRQIAERLRNRPYVLVKGPPGTGKSHTIANLICHLLASGERILVTAHAPKALAVLRDLLPDDIRHLCVIAFGSSREDHRLLEESVRGILSQKNEWKGQKWAQDELARLEQELCELENKIAKVERQLLECRKAETHFHTLPGGYTGTPAQIARQIEQKRELYGWFPELTEEHSSCPLQTEDIAFLTNVHAVLTKRWMEELRLEIGEFSLPTPEEFTEEVEKLNALEQEVRSALARMDRERQYSLHRADNVALEASKTFLNELEEMASRLQRIFGDLSIEIIRDLLIGQSARWERLEKEVLGLAEKIEVARKRAGSAKIEVPRDIEHTKLLFDAQRRLAHFRENGSRGWGIFAPRVVRETRYIEKCCLVNGKPACKLHMLDMLVGYLELQDLLNRFDLTWPRIFESRSSDFYRAAQEVCDLAHQFHQLMEFFRRSIPKALDVIPVERREALAERHERTICRQLIEIELAQKRLQLAKEPLREWLRLIRSILSDNHHPCVEMLVEALEKRDAMRWRIAWEQREELRAAKERVRRYEHLLAQLRSLSPELAALLVASQGDPEWTDRLRHLSSAWEWAAAKAWLRKVASPQHYARLTAERRRLQYKIEQKLQELAALKAWQAFFIRLDDQTEQNLIAWTKAIARIGKGTGKYAYRHRRTARQYLVSCVSKIPAWIMPLHKLWETTEPIPGIFDTVIVDEASQAGIDSLVLLLLAKRIIVVGDDKQNSPMAVGVLEDDIARVAREHLTDFRFLDEFRPDVSLYDHAERAFGNVISLREHFRCVPEIIRFSNELCYSDAPLIPLRQPPPKRLSPLKAKFVMEGSCEGDGQRLLNRTEAEAIIEQICKCIDDKAYQGKTMGVVALQGHAQAEFIERRLAEVLEPRVREARKLRCGDPATFQGDQRDVVFLSLVIAPNHHFRALTGLADQRRFNVAMSRARDQVWLFHSVQLQELNPEDLRWQLLRFFYNPNQSAFEKYYESLDRIECEAKRRVRQPDEQPEPYDSWFEVDVALELLRRRYCVRPQVKVAGHRIDLVVEGDSNRLAVECDGEIWHGPEQFEQDMARQRQLERAGWTFVRIRESEFYGNRENTVGRILQACKELKIQPLQRSEGEINEDFAQNI